MNKTKISRNVEPYLRAFRQNIVFGGCVATIGAFAFNLSWEPKNLIAVAATAIGVSLLPKVTADIRDFIRTRRQ